MRNGKVKITTSLLALSLALTSINPAIVMANSPDKELELTVESEDKTIKDEDNKTDEAKESTSKNESKEKKDNKDKKDIDELDEEQKEDRDQEVDQEHEFGDYYDGYYGGGGLSDGLDGSDPNTSNEKDKPIKKDEPEIDIYDFLTGDDFTPETEEEIDIPETGVDVDNSVVGKIDSSPTSNTGSSNSGVNFDYFDAPNKRRSTNSNSNSYDSELGGSNQEIKSMKTTRREFDTMQYTFDTTGEYPVYIDTGIEVGEDGKLSIEAMEEFLTQVSMKGNGKIVEDEDRLLLILDGSPLIVKEGITTAKDLEREFSSGPVRVKVQKSRLGGKYNLAEELEVKGSLNVSVDGKEIELVTNPSIDNSEVLFPIRSIGGEMGAEVTWDKDKGEALVVKGDKRMVFKLNSDIVIVNGKDVKMAKPTEIRSGESRILSLITILVNELGGEVEFDTYEGVLVIETEEMSEELQSW